MGGGGQRSRNEKTEEKGGYGSSDRGKASKDSPKNRDAGDKTSGGWGAPSRRSDRRQKK